MKTNKSNPITINCMRNSILLFSLLAFSACAGSKSGMVKPAKLNGSWTPVYQEIAGSALPEAALNSQKLMLENGTYTVIAESTDKGTVEYNGNKLDIYGKEGVNAGKHFTAIYKYEKKQLTICYNLLGDSYPENFVTKGHPMYFLSVFKKN